MMPASWLIELWHNEYFAFSVSIDTKGTVCDPPNTHTHAHTVSMCNKKASLRAGSISVTYFSSHNALRIEFHHSSHIACRSWMHMTWYVADHELKCSCDGGEGRRKSALLCSRGMSELSNSWISSVVQFSFHGSTQTPEQLYSQADTVYVPQYVPGRVWRSRPGVCLYTQKGVRFTAGRVHIQDLSFWEIIIVKLKLLSCIRSHLMETFSRILRFLGDFIIKSSV